MFSKGDIYGFPLIEESLHVNHEGMVWASE
jgi:hypothetical protein